MPELGIAEIERQLNECLGGEYLQRCGRETGLEQRAHRGIPTNLLVCSLLATLGSRKVETLADLHRDFQAFSESTVNYKPFYEKLDKPGFAPVMQAVFERILRQLSLRILTPAKSSPLRWFDDIVVQDGSSVTLHDELRDAFPSRFTKVHPAGAELHVTMSLWQQAAQKVQISADKEGERAFLPDAATLKNKLFLADRGYESLKYLFEVDRAGGFFAVRIRLQAKPIVVRVLSGSRRLRRQTGKPLDEALAHASKSECADLLVAFPKSSRHPACTFRLVVRKLRKPRLDRKHKDKWIRILTNVSPERLSKEQVLQAYRLRWQIELFFKELKSYANLKGFCTRKKTIAAGLFWASLCAAALKRYVAFACQLHRRVAAISPRRVAMCGHTFLPQLLSLLQTGSRRLASTLQQILGFLSKCARRANPNRERKRGLLALDLVPRGVLGLR